MNTANMFDLGPAAMREYFEAAGERPYRASQVLKWVYHRGVTDPDRMTDISKPLRQKLSASARFHLPEIVSEQQSGDGTRKWLLRVDPVNCIESVFIPEPDRGTLCVSSQVGCPLDCSFCSTGKQGFGRNLEVSEIIGQLWLVNERLGCFQGTNRVITNVVLMGMGEPLLNFDNVLTAVSLMTDDLAFNLAQKRVTLSTAGVVPGIDRLAGTAKISLAVSLHAPNDALRDVLVPINRRYPLAELMAACRRFAAATGGDAITFEYVMLRDVNDSPAHARDLARLLADVPAKINLIPFNAFPNSIYTRSDQNTIDRFREILMQAGKIAITRKTRGDDIDAACGQLVGRVVPRAARLRRDAEQRV